MDGSGYLETEEAKAYLSQARNRAFEKTKGMHTRRYGKRRWQDRWRQ